MFLPYTRVTVISTERLISKVAASKVLVWLAKILWTLRRGEWWFFHMAIACRWNHFTLISKVIMVCQSSGRRFTVK